MWLYILLFIWIIGKIFEGDKGKKKRKKRRRKPASAWDRFFRGEKVDYYDD